MIAEFLFSQAVSTAETREDLDPASKEPTRGIMSDAELLEYCEVAGDILEKAEKHFPEFAADTGTTVNVYFVDNGMIRDINRDERGIDRATDVLSFPFLDMNEGDGIFDEYDLNPENGAIMLGELVVSVEKVKEQAAEYGHSEKRELAFLLCHGFLHLMGYDHETPEEEAVMKPLTEKLLKEAGYTRN